MFAGRRAQAYCLSPVLTGGDLLEHTLLPQQKDPKAPSQFMAPPAPNDERWRVFVSSCANTGVLILANSTTTVSHLQAETVRRHQIQYPEHDVASCRRLYAKHALEQGNLDWWAVADATLVSGFAPPGEVHFHADLFDSAGNQCQPLGQPAAASAAGQPANSEPAAAVMVNPPQPPLIEHPLPLGYNSLLGDVDDDFLEVESAPQESVSGGNSQQDGSLHISVPSASAVAAQRHRVQQQLLLQQQQQQQQQQEQHQQEQQQQQHKQQAQQQQQAQYGSQRAQRGSEPAQQQAEQQAQHESQRAQHGSQHAQHGSQPAQQQAQQRGGYTQSVSHKRRLSQAFAQVRGLEQTPGDEAEEEPQVKRQRHGGEQAVMAQHQQSPSGAPDKLCGKMKRQSLSRQAYKQKQRARKNPPSSQAAHQSGVTDPSQPAAAPSSGTPVQQAPDRQADVSMLFGLAAASAAARMTDPGPSTAAPAAHVTNVSGAQQHTGKLSRRQKMRLSFQRQLEAAQAAAVMQQQQLSPPKNKSTFDMPASVPTQGPSKVSVNPGVHGRPAASLKAPVSAPGSESDSSSESSSGSETDPDVRLARSRKLTQRHLSSPAATAAPTAAATAVSQKAAAEKEVAANHDSDGEAEEEPNESASASAASSPSSSSEEEEEEKQVSETAAPAQMREHMTAAADESSSSEAESESSSSDEEEEDQAALPASAPAPDHATSLQAGSSPESSSSEEEKDEVSPTAQPSPDQARVASNSPSTQPSSSEDEEDEQMPDAPVSLSDQAPHDDSSDDSSSVTSTSDSEEEDEQNPDAAALPLLATASSSDESSSDSSDSEEEEDQDLKVTVSAPDHAPPDTEATASSTSDHSSSASSSEEEEDQPVPAATAALPDQAPPDSPESLSSDESSSDSSSEEDEDQPMQHASAEAYDMKTDGPAAATVPVQVAGSSSSFSSSDDSSSDSDSSEEEDVAMPDAAAAPDQAASGDSFSSSDDSSIDSDSSEEEEGDEPMPEAAAAAPDQAPVAMPDHAPHVPAAVPDQALAAPQSSSDFSSNGSSSSGSSDEETDQAAAPAAAAAADESSGGSVGSKNQVSMAAALAGNESSGECDNIASDREEAEDRPAAAQQAGHVADDSPASVGQEEGQGVLQAATAALHRLSTEGPSDLTSSGASSSSSDSSAASASSSSSSDDAASSSAPSSSSPGVSEGPRDAAADAAAAAAEEEGGMNEYDAPAEPAHTWALEALSSQPALLDAFTNRSLFSLLNSAVEVKGLQEQSAAHLEAEDDQLPAMDEQPGPSGAAPARATPAGQNAEDRPKKQSKRALADDKGPLTVSEDSECLDQVALRPHQDWGKADKLAQIVRRAAKAWLNEDRLTRGLKEVNSNIYINNTAPIWWPLPKWDSTQLHRKADCQKVYMALQKFMREAGQHQPQ